MNWQIYCCPIFAHQYPINFSNLHHKAIPFESFIWHTQVAPSCTSIHCSPWWLHILFFFTLPCNIAVCVFISPSPSPQLADLLWEKRGFLKPQETIPFSSKFNYLLWTFSTFSVPLWWWGCTLNRFNLSSCLGLSEFLPSVAVCGSCQLEGM